VTANASVVVVAFLVMPIASLMVVNQAQCQLALVSLVLAKFFSLLLGGAAS